MIQILYIDMSDKENAEPKEIAAGIVVDFDKNGNLVGIDIDNASRIVDLKHFEINSLPLL